MKTDFTAKTTLAKLLAKEDITVIESNMHTAYFDVKNRVLGLPSWKDRGKDVYDMLIGHEVGHALYTPVDALERFHAKCGSTPFDVCNIVEDIRIERIIQNTYPGLPRIFKTAYTILTDEDFFSIKDKDISSLNFLDRLNLRGKIGTIKSIPLSLDEEVIYKKCLNAESFDDVLDICLEIKELIENEENSKDDSNDSDSDESEESEPEECEGEKSCTDSADDAESDEESDDDSESHSNDSDSDESDDSDCEASSNDITSDNESDDSAKLDESDDSANDGREPETPQNMLSETIKSFESTLSKEVETPSSRGYTPLIAPRRSYIYDTIIDYKKLAADRRDASEGAYTLSNSHRVEQFSEFKKITNKKVGTLVREFEQRKAAFQYSRATQSRTGKLDVNKLHSYTLTDELFLSQTKLADAKSHGMIFLLDYSGSMSNVIGDVIMQTLNLITFCKKVNIPFRVYSFTSTWFYKEDHSRPSPAPHEVDLSNVSLVEQISSDLSKANYDEAFKSLWISATYGVRYSKYDQLGGTPLNAVLTMMPTVINDFIAKHSVQKLNFVTLTDGDSERLRSNTNFKGEASSSGKYRVNLAGKTHQFNPRDTSTLMSIIHNMPCVTTLGFYLPSCKKGVRNAINRMAKWDQKKLSKYTKIHKKDGFVVVEATGYDTYYVLDHTVKIDDTEFEFQNDGVDIASTKRAQTKLAKEFSKHHGAARKTRVLLTNIATQIA